LDEEAGQPAFSFSLQKVARVADWRRNAESTARPLRVKCGCAISRVSMTDEHIVGNASLCRNCTRRPPDLDRTPVLQRPANGEDPATLTPRSWKAQRPAVTLA